MPALVIAALFWLAVVAVVVAQARILASSARVLRAAPPARPLQEWLFALVPALALAVLLAASWRATMRPAPIQVEVLPLPGEIRS